MDNKKTSNAPQEINTFDTNLPLWKDKIEEKRKANIAAHSKLYISFLYIT